MHRTGSAWLPPHFRRFCSYKQLTQETFPPPGGSRGGGGRGGRGAGRQGPGAGWWVWRLAGGRAAGAWGWLVGLAAWWHGGMAAWSGIIGFELPGDTEMFRWLAFNDLKRRKQWIFPRKNRFFGLGVAQIPHWLTFSDLMRRKQTFSH